MSTSASAPRLPPRSNLGAWLASVPPPLDCVLPGFVRGTVGGLVSPGGEGKSYWALALAVAMAGGTAANLTGLAPAKGRVLMLAGEDPEPVVAARLHALMAHLPKGVSLEAFDYRACLGWDMDVMAQPCFDAVQAAAYGCRLVILDTLSRFHHLDENSSLDMKRLLARLEQLAVSSGAAVLYVHHTSKAAALSGQGMLQQAARGSSVLVDNARWVAYLAMMSATEARRFDVEEGAWRQYVRWNVSKQNYGPAMPDLWYRRDAAGVLLPVSLMPKGGAARCARAADSVTPCAVVQPAIPVAQVRAPRVPSATNAFDGQW